MTYMTKQELRRHLLNAPPGTTPGGIVSSLRKQGVIMEGDPAMQEVQQGHQNGLFNKLGQRLSNIGEEFTGTFEDKESILGNVLSPIRGGVRIVGQAAGAVGDVFGSALTGGAKVLGAVTPDVVEKPIIEGAKNIGIGILKTPIGQVALRAIEGGMETWQNFKSSNPEIAKDIEAVINIGMLLPISKVTKVGKEAAVSALKPITEPIVQFQAKRAISGLDDVIETALEKGIRPTVRGKKSVLDLQILKNRGKEAVKTIVERRDALKFTDDLGNELTGELPKNLMEFGQAIQQTKKSLFQEYDDLAKQAGKKGVMVDLSDVASKLDEVAESKAKQLGRPQVAEAAKRAAARFRKAKELTPQQTDDLIQELNQSLQSFYVSGANKSQAQVDASIAEVLRRKLDDSVEMATGKEFQLLKNKYGSLKSIEKDVVNRALVDARKNAKGLLDFTDIFTGGDIIGGLISLNPAMIARGATGRGIKEIFKRLNDPNRIVRKMFEHVDDVLRKSSSVTEDIIRP